MRAFLEKISPANHAAEIKAPLFIIQGENDPRVPATEARQMRDAIQKNGGSVWYLMAADEGHGFTKKKDMDFQFHATVLFFQEHLLK
jgi:dipeptidyl aminopeptidase/acylaminoacyl peptidase